MRLVCPNCVAQYEVADGTIPDSGRDVQCANCGHIWFQDAAFKLSTDDLTYVPQKLKSPHLDLDEDDDDAPGVFHSKRAARMPADPAGTAERALPEIGNNVLDILRSEAAFSSRRRAEAKAEHAEPEAEADNRAQDDKARTQSRHRPIGTRTSDIQPQQPPHAEEPEAAQPAADIPPADIPATDHSAGERSSASRKVTWRHMGGDRHDDTATSGLPLPEDNATASDAVPEDDTESPADLGWTRRILHDEPEPATDIAGRADDEIKETAEAAVAEDEDEPAPEATQPPEEALDSAAEQAEEFRQTLRRVSVRSLAEASVGPEPASAEATGIASGNQMLHTQAEPDEDEDAYGSDYEEEVATVEDEIATVEDEVAAFEDAAKFDAGDNPENDTAEAEFGSDTETIAETYLKTDIEEEDPDAEAEAEPEPEAEAETEAAPDETAPTLADIKDLDDIRQVRRSLVENRKVLLPDVDELNTSLRMEKTTRDVDLRASAFSEEDIANRNRFWLGLVTALMLFGILAALYLMGPAISDTFPATDPYVTAYRDMIDTALDATARAWGPVVDWLESL